jgi:GT2 family glycosyltransferase
MPEIFIVILNYKNWQEVVECLESVFRSSYRNFKVIVVDNASGNDSLEHLMKWADGYGAPSGDLSYQYFRAQDLDGHTDPASFSRLVFIQNDKNSGFAGGNNVALRLLTGQKGYIWMLNPDMVIQENTLTELVNFSASRPPRSITGIVIKFHDHPDKVHMYGGGRINFDSATSSLIWEQKDIVRLDYISGGALFTRAQNFRELGLLPEEYFLYWEETDWCYRAREKGYELNICLTAVGYDKVGTSVGRGFLADYYYTRNGLLFVDKYKTGKIRRALFAAYLRLMKRVLCVQWARARGVYQGIHAFTKRSDRENQ